MKKRTILWILTSLVIVTTITGFLTYMHIAKTAPSVASIKGCLKTSMNKVWLCRTSQNYTPLENISDHVINALLVSEDVAFFSHEGFDWHEIKASAKTNIKKGRFSRGGSTITQQLAKNVFLSPEKTIIRKLKEAYLATKIEEVLSKKQILEKYLNVVEFGPNIYGVKRASQHYFSKTPGQLSVLEAAYLIHLLPNPKAYSQGFREEKLTDYSKQRILTICRKMKDFDKIESEEYEVAQNKIDYFPWDGASLLNVDEWQPSFSLLEPIDQADQE